MAASDRHRSLALAVILVGASAACPPELGRQPPTYPDLPGDRSPGLDRTIDVPTRDAPLHDRGPDRKLCSSAAACDDGLACTSDACQDGVCLNQAQSGSCVIAGACVTAGSASSQDPCLTCDPSKSTSGWTRQVCVTTLAGTAVGKHLDGAATTACFNQPTGVAVDAAGTVVIVADSLNRRIRQITGGQVTTLAGSGAAGQLDGPAATATFMLPHGVALDAAASRVYVADKDANKIRLVESGQVSTFAGKNGDGDDNGAALEAGFRRPTGVHLGPGQLLVADSDNDRIRTITLVNPTVSTLAGGSGGFQDGNAQDARFNTPYGVAADAAGRVLVADRVNHRIRAIAAQTVTTLAGSGAGYVDGPGQSAKLNQPMGVAVDAKGMIVVADYLNHRIRMIAPDGTVSTLAGGAAATFADGPGDKARFSHPVGVAVDGTGRIFVADALNHRIRVITR